jgi:hypothetical protein
MKILRVLLIAILISLVGYPAYSQESLVLYDNFQGESIDPNKWLPLRVPNEILDVKRFIKGNRLYLMERSYGGPEWDGRISTRIRLAFQKPNVTAIQAKIKVNHVEVVGCTSNPRPTSRVRVGRLSGSFFNTGPEDPPTSAINDVFAAIEIVRESILPDPDGMLRIRGYVFHCSDVECNEGALIGDIVELGTITVGHWATLLIQWERDYAEDGATGAFIFQRDNDPEEISPYNVEDDLEPLDPHKRIGISARVPNCAEEPRPVGYAEVEIKDVFVNESALGE